MVSCHGACIMSQSQLRIRNQEMADDMDETTTSSWKHGGMRIALPMHNKYHVNVHGRERLVISEYRSVGWVGRVRVHGQCEMPSVNDGDAMSC